MKPIRIILADDHKIFLEALKEMIDHQPGIEVVATAQHGEELMIKLQSYHVDVVILDIQMPRMNGIHTAAEVLRRYPDIKVLMLSMYSDQSFFQQAFDMGVHGFLVKSADKTELIEAIHALHSGKKHYKGDAALSFLAKNTARYAQSVLPALSKREKEVLILIAREYSNTDIAELLHLSVETINTHRKNLLQKLGVKNTAGLVKYAIYQRLITE